MRGIARHRLAVATAAVAALMLAAAGCGGHDRVYPRAPIVLLSIDTLRSDHLPAYGYRAVATPAIDSLRAESVLFRRVFSHVPLTFPSHVSILTGQLPTVTGVRDNVGYPFDARRFPTLATVLHGVGYKTGGAVSAYVLRGDTGIAAGFDRYDSEVSMKFSQSLGNSQRPGPETVAAALRWLAGAKDQPFFLFVHLYEPHSPYDPPEPFRSRYAANPYDGEIAAADACVAQLIAGLKQLGVYDQAIFLFLSDHGEGLFEHGEPEHGILLYRETLQVPLLLKLPGGHRGGATVEEPAQLVDVFPTLLGLVGVTGPPAPPPAGRSLLALAGAGTRSIYSETYYPRLHFGWSELTSLARDRYHYIHGPQPELFDLVADAGEKHNVLHDQRRAYAEMRDALSPFEHGLAAPGAVDAETARRLAALGYASAPVRAAPGEQLPDPKSELPSLRDFNVGMTLIGQQRLAEAIPPLQRVVAANPRMVEAWEQLGAALKGEGRYEDALAASKKALDLSGGAGYLAVEVAATYLALDRYGEAKAHAELGLASAPPGAHNVLAQVALAQGDFAEAERQARAGLGVTSAEHVGPWLTLAIALGREGKLEEGLKEVDAARAELVRTGSTAFSGLHWVRGDLLARAGRGEEAEREFEAEIHDFPGDPRPYNSLAMLYASEGRTSEALAAIGRLIDRGSLAAYAGAVRTLRVLGDVGDASAVLRRALAAYPNSKELRDLAS